jgi:hypothetical protein
MERNTVIEGVIILLVIILIIYLVSRNRKDQKKIEQEMNQSEIKPEKHDDDQV